VPLVERPLSYLVDALRLALQSVLDAIRVVEDVGELGEVLGHISR